MCVSALDLKCRIGTRCQLPPKSVSCVAAGGLYGLKYCSSVTRIAIAPSDRLRPFVVLPNVGANAPREVWHGREDPARQQIAFDFRKPEFDQVQPRGIGRCEVQLDVWMLHQEVGGQVEYEAIILSRTPPLDS